MPTQMIYVEVEFDAYKGVDSLGFRARSEPFVSEPAHLIAITRDDTDVVIIVAVPPRVYDHVEESALDYQIYAYVEMLLIVDGIITPEMDHIELLRVLLESSNGVSELLTKAMSIVDLKFAPRQWGRGSGDEK